MTRTVLVVEDEAAIADTLAYALRRESFHVIVSATARDACKALETAAVDLVVLDVGLPDRNGFDLCRDIRAVSRLPVLFLTARDDEVDRIVGLEIGADDYVTKPFSPREVAARVKAILRRSTPPPSPASPPPAVESPFQVDRPRARIAYRGKPLDLTRYEFRILEILVRRPGWVFSRAQLLEQGWEEPDSSDERTVDTHIKTIRAKLRQVDPATDPIRTHRGLGYSLKETW